MTLAVFNLKKQVKESIFDESKKATNRYAKKHCFDCPRQHEGRFMRQAYQRVIPDYSEHLKRMDDKI